MSIAIVAKTTVVVVVVVAVVAVVVVIAAVSWCVAVTSSLCTCLCTPLVLTYEGSGVVERKGGRVG